MSMSSRVVVLTGATSGIGEATARGLLRRGAHVIMAVRDTRRGADLKRALVGELPQASIDIVECNLASRRSVDACADVIYSRYDALDVLINNAGTMLRRPHMAESGFERTFATNHLGHFQLTGRLLPLLIHDDRVSQVVTVASSVHRRAELPLEELRHVRGYNMWRAYARSKLANVMFSNALARRFEHTNLRANCLHPGMIASRILPRKSLWWRTLSALGAGLGVLSDPQRGAATSLYLALDPAASNLNGQYLDPHQIPRACAAVARSHGQQEHLWALSAAATGLKE
ncbi:MAG: SDR family NAD(P)-dependent oxidoreductase [Pseudomonadota bacterium]